MDAINDWGSFASMFSRLKKNGFPRVAVIVLNWNGCNDTLDCLRSLSELTYPHNEVIVVDNGSIDDSVREISKAFPEVTVLTNSKNLGFAEGNNVGIRYAIERSAQFIFLVNNDAVLEKTALNQMIAMAERDGKIGILGPRILFYDRPEYIESSGAKMNLLTGRTYHHDNGKREKKGQGRLVEEVDIISGCAMLIRRQVIEDIGYLDADFFCYMEDADFCVRARKAGYRIVNIPTAKIWHKGARSSGGYGSPERIYYSVRNHLLLVNKNRPLKKYILKGMRDLHIIILFVLYILFVSPVKKLKAMIYLKRGIQDFTARRFGAIGRYYNRAR